MEHREDYYVRGPLPEPKIIPLIDINKPTKEELKRKKKRKNFIKKFRSPFTDAIMIICMAVVVGTSVYKNYIKTLPIANTVIEEEYVEEEKTILPDFEDMFTISQTDVNFDSKQNKDQTFICNYVHQLAYKGQDPNKTYILFNIYMDDAYNKLNFSDVGIRINDDLNHKGKLVTPSSIYQHITPGMTISEKDADYIFEVPSDFEDITLVLQDSKIISFPSHIFKPIVELSNNNNANMSIGVKPC